MGIQPHAFVWKMGRTAYGGIVGQRGKQLRFRLAVSNAVSGKRRVKPKQVQRKIRNQMHQGIDAKAQQALKLQRQQGRNVRWIDRREGSGL